MKEREGKIVCEMHFDFCCTNWSQDTAKKKIKVHEYELSYKNAGPGRTRSIDHKPVQPMVRDDIFAEMILYLVKLRVRFVRTCFVPDTRRRLTISV